MSATTRRPRTPDTIEGSVCLSCGTPTPDVVAADCTHPRVARFERMTPELRSMIVKVRQARRYVANTLAAVEEIARLEAAAGHAIVDEENATFSPGPNVTFLRPRNELVGRTRPAPSGPSSPGPDRIVIEPLAKGPPPPPLALKPAKPKRANPKAAANLPKRERPADPDPASASLFGDD